MNTEALRLANALNTCAYLADPHDRIAILSASDMLRQQAAEIERIRQCLRWQDDRDGHIGTHGPECYTYGGKHYECALREIERLRVSVEQMKRAIVGLLLTDPAGAREDWPEYVAAREAIDQWRKA